MYYNGHVPLGKYAAFKSLIMNIYFGVKGNSVYWINGYFGTIIGFVGI